MNKFIAGFLGSAIVIAFVFWLGGYDFDKRGELVAICAMFSIALSFIGGMVAKDFL